MGKLSQGNGGDDSVPSGSLPDDGADDSLPFEERVLAVVRKWVVGAFFGLFSAFLGLQLTVGNQVRTAFSSAWSEVTGAVSTVTGLGFGILEVPFDVARSLVLTAGPAAFLVGPLTFAIVVAFVMIVITGSWYLYQVIPGT